MLHNDYDINIIIDFMVLSEGIISHFEILKEYRNKGYIRELLKQIKWKNPEGICSSSVEFWKKMEKYKS